MSAVLTIGADTFDLRFTDHAPPPLTDVSPLNPLYATSGLILPPSPKFPDPQLNALVWPVTGLSHYAYGHVLVANETAYTSGTACTLKLTDDEADTAREFSLYILDRRPFCDTRGTLTTAPANTNDGVYFDGWILTLVDPRYVRRSAIVQGDALSILTWGDLIHDLGTLGGFTMQSASTIQALVHADFGTPNPDRWTALLLEGEAYSVACDAAAASVGLRLVVSPAGTVTAQKASTATTAYTSWLSATGRDTFRHGGITTDRYTVPSIVRCDGDDELIPAPTPRLFDTEIALLDLPGDNTFRDQWVIYYSDWTQVTAVHGDVNGFVLPPVTGAQQHAQYLLQSGITRIASHPARYPLPLNRQFNVLPGLGGAIDVLIDGGVLEFELATQNLDNTEIGVTSDMRFEQATGVEIRQSPGGVDWDQVRLREATPTQWGAVTTNYQTVGGRKRVTVGEDGSRGAWFTQATPAAGDTSAPYIPFQAAYLNGVGGTTNDVYEVRMTPAAASVFVGYDKYTDTDVQTNWTSAAQTLTTLAVRRNILSPLNEDPASNEYLQKRTALTFLVAPASTPNTEDCVVACGDPTRPSHIHTWGHFKGTTLRRGITSVTTGPLLVPHEWSGGLVVTQKTLTALSPSSPPPPYAPPGYSFASPPAVATSPPPVATSPPLPQGYNTPGQSLSVDSIGAASVVANRLIMRSPDGSSWDVRISNGGLMTITTTTDFEVD